LNAYYYKGLTLIVLIGIAISLSYLSYLRYEKRILFTEYQNLIRERDRLENDWRRLLVEEVVHKSLPRIEVHARENLGLINLENEHTLLVINEQVISK
jgi:cell division protein FtsL